MKVQRGEVRATASHLVTCFNSALVSCVTLGRTPNLSEPVPYPLVTGGK